MQLGSRWDQIFLALLMPSTFSAVMKSLLRICITCADMMRA